MSRNYYITQPGRLRRKTTLSIWNEKMHHAIPIPVEDIDALYFYGNLTLTPGSSTFSHKNYIAFHVFNYYGYYSGSTIPRDS